jgi:hypothetical protein
VLVVHSALYGVEVAQHMRLNDGCFIGATAITILTNVEDPGGVGPCSVIQVGCDALRRIGIIHGQL